MEIVCPECGAGENYLLADGRRKCRVCRRKFTPGGRKRKLAVSAQEAIREAFWEMRTAEEVAHSLNLNRKTVQKMYGEFRQKIKDYNRQLKSTLLHEEGLQSRAERHVELIGKSGEFPMFYLVECEDTVVICQADEIDRAFSALKNQELPVLMVYRRQGESLLLDPEDIYRRMLCGQEQGDRCLACLDFMLKKMKAYRGVHEAKSSLYAEEMLFRFNCRDKTDVWRSLLPALEDEGVKH